MRRTFELAFSLILVLLLLACGTRSYWVTDTWSWGTPHSDNFIASTGGRLVYADAAWPNVIPVRGLQYHAAPRNAPIWYERPEHTDGFRALGFEFTRAAFPYDRAVANYSFFMPSWRVIAIPYWFAFALAAIHPLARWLAILRRARLRRQKRCARCGYDLRATPDRCPECGPLPIS